MKKIIAFLAVASLMMFTACESNTTTAEETTVAETTTVSEVELTTAATEEVTEETTTEEATEAETSEESGDTELFHGTGYTLEIDGDNWLNASEYISAIAENVEDYDLGLTAEDVESMADTMYYNAHDLNVNFNVVVADMGVDMGEFSTELYEAFGETLKPQYEAMAGYNFESYEVTTVNGINALRFDLTSDAEVFGVDLKITAYQFFKGTAQYAITYTAAKDSYDARWGDFEEVLNSISFE